MQHIRVSATFGWMGFYQMRHLEAGGRLNVTEGNYYAQKPQASSKNSGSLQSTHTQLDPYALAHSTTEFESSSRA